MSMNIMGSYSGIDKAQIDKLMEAEKLPLIQMSNKKVKIDQQKSAWKDVNTRLKSLFDKMEALKDKKLFDSKLAKSSDDKIMTAQANDKAIAGTYKINVTQVATGTRIIGKQSNVTEVTENSKLKIKNHDGKEVEIDVKEGDSLENIADKINDKSKKHIGDDGKPVEGTGIKATVIDGRLVLEDSKMGNRNIVVTSDENNALTEIGLDGFDKEYSDEELKEMSKKSMKEVNGKENNLSIGRKSEFEVNGIKMESDSNNVSDKVRGLTLNFNDTGKSTITVADDSAKMEKAVQEFVDQYNSTMTYIDEQLKAGDPKVKDSRGALAGDSALMSLQRNLRSLVTDKMNRGGSDKKFEIDSPSQLGISTVDEKGTLSFDTSKFKDVLKENPNGIRDFFGKEETGFVDRFNGHIDKMISTKNGIIKTKNETFDRTLKDLNKQIDAFNDRMERKEKYYIKTFTALDVAMMQAESQMSWLSNQVSAMNPGK